MMRLTLWLLVLTAAAFLMTSCGKRGGLEHDPNQNPKPTDPRTYPSK